MTAPVPFDYGDKQVRTVQLDGETWWVAVDVATVLGYTRPSDMTRLVRAEDRKRTRILRGNRGNPDILVVSQPGLFTILTKSQRSEALPFQRWVTAEVLPALARGESYSLAQTRDEPMAEVVAQPRNELEVLRAVVDQLIATREVAERAELTARDAADEAKVANARLDAIEGRHNYYAAVGWANLTGFQPTDEMTLSRLGKIAASIGRARGIPSGTSPHSRFGTVLSWPEEVWHEAAARFRGRR